MKTSVYRVDFMLNTNMWNEGFSEARLPWLRLYTDDPAVQSAYPVGSVIEASAPTPGSHWPQDFTVRIDHVIVDDKVVDEEVHEFRRDHGITAAEEPFERVSWQPSKRYLWLVGEPLTRIQVEVRTRLDAWDGV